MNGLYGAPPLALAPPRAGAVQLSPLSPGSTALEALGTGDLSEGVILAPPGTVERRYVLALALRALAPDGRLSVMAPKDKGGSRLKGELETFGCKVVETSKAHHRLCIASGSADSAALDLAVQEGAPQFVSAIGLWSQPGVFSWNRIDPGSALLAQHLPALSGRGADLGCGLGYLAHAVLASPGVSHLTLLDTDRRAVEAARRNVDDPRVDIRWEDVRAASLSDLDFVVMNPPFHDGGAEDKRLGQQFIIRAHDALRKAGALWLVANRHLPYEAGLAQQFKSVTLKSETGPYKVYEARK
jgi:16S rRNA (guanine1207-N2)-methyltransferase